MSEGFPPADAHLPATVAGRVDEACDRFEVSWKAGRRPGIEEALVDAPGPERADLLLELLTLELAYRRRLGERPEPAEYQGRFPEHAEAIGLAFAAAEPK